MKPSNQRSASKSVTFFSEDTFDGNHREDIPQPLEDFDARQYVLPGAKLRDVEIWKEVFDLFDLDRSGSLTPMNIRNAMLTLGYNPKRQIIYQLVSDLDGDESGGIEFQEFVKMMVAKPSDKDTDQEIEEVFYIYDADKKGYITKEDMLRTAKELKEELNEDEIDVIFSEVDPKEDGRITLRAWREFMRKKTYGT